MDIMDTLVSVASFALAVGCSYAALHITAKSVFKSTSINLGLMLIGAIVWGTGSWAMHYLEMLTARFEGIQINYSAPLIFISLFVPILSTYAALVPVSLPLPEGARCFIGTVVVTMGVSSLHFIGMAAMQMNAVLSYDYALLLFSIFFAIAMNYSGFRLFIYERFRRARLRIAWSALLLGASMTGMHHMALAGTTAIRIETEGVLSSAGLDAGDLSTTVAIVVSVVFTLTLASYHFAKGAAARLEKLIENETLYYNVFSNSKNAVLILRPDAEGTIFEANDQACKLLGRARNELLGAPLGQVVTKRAGSAASHESYGGQEEWELTSEEGCIRLIGAVTGRVDIDGHAKYRTAFLRDITSQPVSRMIAGISRTLSQLAVSGMPSHLLLPLLRHLTNALFPAATIRFDQGPGTTFFEANGSAPGTRNVVSWDGTILGRLTLTRNTEQPFTSDGMEEAWLDKCTDCLEISIFAEYGTGEGDRGLDTWVGVLNEQLRFEFVGHTANALLGYEPESLLHSSLLELIHPDDAKLSYLRVRRAEDLKAPHRFNVRLRHKDGEWVDFRTIFAAIVSREQARIVLMAQRKAADRNVVFRYDEGEKYDFLFDHHPGPVVCMGLDGRFLKVNRELEKLTGYGVEELLGESYEKVVWVGDLEKTRAHVEQAAKGKASSYEIRVLRKDGGVVPLQVTNFPAIEGTEVMGVFGISVDTTTLGRGAAEETEKEEGIDEEGGDDQRTNITKREKEVIRLINRGMSNKEIAAELEISENTVKNHISNIFAKLKISDRNQVPMLLPDHSAEQE